MRAAGEFAWVPLGQRLQSAGLISEDQLDRLLRAKSETGQRVGEIAVGLGFVSERQIATVLAEQYNLEFVDLGDYEPDAAVVAVLPERYARRYEALPLQMLEDDIVLLAVVDPTNLLHADELRLAIGMGFRMMVADAAQMSVAIARAYRRPFIHLVGEEGKALEEQAIDDIRDSASSVPTINLVNSLLTTAIEERASDIHFSPESERLVVRIRVDGVLRDLTTIPKAMQAAVTSRLKIMASLDIAERRVPQDGRVSARFGGDPIDLRVAILPATNGEHVVLRILGRQEAQPRLAELDMEPAAERAFVAAIREPYGAVVVCGPTGSGKTTTLYAALRHLDDRGRSLTTIEDPVEFQMDGVTQIEVDPRAGLTFARGLRTILRSDPDVLLVGEIRDEETASIAVHAAMTGHLVLTSLHAHTAAAAIARLRDMGIEPGLLSSSLNCIVAQRLVRRLCGACKEPYEATASDLQGLSTAFDGVVTLHRAVGCNACAGTGYRGRIAVREVMPVQGEVRALIERSTEEIFAAAIRLGMTTLRADALRVCVAGVSTVEELRRVTGGRIV